MKTPSEGAEPKRIDKPTAWGITFANLAALPGLGTIAAGRKVGYAQAALALIGFGLSLTWMVLFVRDWHAEGRLPIEFRPSLLIGVAGVGIWGSGWLWALSTSVKLHRDASARSREPGGNHGPNPSPPTPPRL